MSEAATCRQVTMSSRFRLLVNPDKIRKLIRRDTVKTIEFGGPLVAKRFPIRETYALSKASLEKNEHLMVNMLTPHGPIEAAKAFHTKDCR